MSWLPGPQAEPSIRLTVPPASVMSRAPAATPGSTGSYCQNRSAWPAATSSIGKVDGTEVRTRSARSSRAVTDAPMRR
jgi:hypothetical protein